MNDEANVMHRDAGPPGPCIFRIDTTSSLTRSVAVAVSATSGTLGKLCLRLASCL